MIRILINISINISSSNKKKKVSNFGIHLLLDYFLMYYLDY